VIPTVAVNPDTLQKLDSKSSSREKDGVAIKLPSQTNVCSLQLWEVYVAVAVLILQPHSSIIFAHVKALCEHNEPKHLCEAVLKEHTSVGTVTDVSQDTSLCSFLEEYFNRKFQIQFAKNILLKYITHVLDDPLCGHDGIARVFLLGPHVQAFLLNAQYWEGQYDELIDNMRRVNLPVNDILKDGEQEIGEAVDITWDNTKLYDDPNLVLKKYGGWAVTKAGRMMTPKDQLVMRLTGCTMDQILKGDGIPDSPRREQQRLAELDEQERNASGAKLAFQKSKSKQTRTMRGRTSHGLSRGRTMNKSKSQTRDCTLFEIDHEDSDDDGDSHASDYDVDPEHPKIVPLGVTLSEMYLLLRGLYIGLESSSDSWRGSVVGQQVAYRSMDGHILAAAVLVDLYMREQIDVHHWTLTEGSIAVAYRAEMRKNAGTLDHFLDVYTPCAELIFRDMRLPADINEGPIWASLEERGVVDNHRPSWERAYGCGFAHVDVWDLVRPDLILDLKAGYLTAARVLYDREFPDPLHEESNDILMFCYLLQLLFNDSMEATDAMASVLATMCPPFEKGQLFPPVGLVHTGSVCLGLIDRAVRFANGLDVQLAMEAAEFNEVVMHRLEETFFLSPSIWETMDTDLSGELSIEEFLQGMRKADVYKDFRKERVPEDVLHTIITDLAERLFREVDINMDGTLTHAELQVAYKRRREDALQQRKEKQWLRRAVRAVAVQTGFQHERKKLHDPERAEALNVQNEARRNSGIQQRQRRNEWLSEVDGLELQDEDVDVDTNVPIFHL